METTSTAQIVSALTRAIVEHRLNPGTKLPEQKLADRFGVSRTVVRQALFQMSQQRLIRLEPARGAFVAAPSATEAQQVFEVRRMLETEMVRGFIRQATPTQIQALQAHVAQEKRAIHDSDIAERTQVLGDFHVRIAQLMDNRVLADILADLIARCSLVTMMYQSSRAAMLSSEEHGAIVQALAAQDEDRAVSLLNQHLEHVVASLSFEPRPTPTCTPFLDR